MPDPNPIYRNKRKNYYSDKSTDSFPIGSIIQVFKAKSNTFDNAFIPTDAPVDGTTAYLNRAGNANPGDNPDYQYEGYLYCDGSEYNINDYPVLYSIIGNDYGGTPGTGVFNSVTIAVTRENIFNIWPSNTLGTFKVPDLKAKKIVGNGPVWGSGSPTVGLNELEVGLGSVGGNWYLSKASQKQQFSLGKITTTGYTNVSTTVPAYVSGSQIVQVNTSLTRLTGPPDHTHLLLHSETSEDDSRPQRGLFDSYLRNYKTKQGKILNFSPSGGLAFQHSHGLARRALTDTTVATYDTFNYLGGDEGVGSIKSPGYYWASTGLSGGGSFEQVTSTDDPAFKTFTSNSVVGGVQFFNPGTAIYQNTGQEYTTAVTGETLNVPTDWSQLRIEVSGGSGSGAVGSLPGNSGGQTRVKLGDGSIFTITATGGSGGGASSTNPNSNTGTGGQAGVNGSASTSGSLSSSLYEFTTITSAENVQPTNGGAGPFWKGIYNQQSDIPSGNKSEGGRNGVTTGSAGETRFISNSNAALTFGPYTSDTTVVIGKSQPYYIFGSPSFELWGGNGGSVGTFGTEEGSCTPTPGLGAYLKFGLNQITQAGTGKLIYPSYTWIFTIGNTPTFDQRSPGGTGYSNGGVGGFGYGSQRSGKDGGAGGGSTMAAISVGSSQSVVAGAGGGGGMGGWDERYVIPRDCNGPGGSATTLVPTTDIIFGGAGLPGGSAGCVGGGGGGGGGGVGPKEGGAGTGGAGGGGAASHGGGIGGTAGGSAIDTNVATVTGFDVNSNYSSGAVLVTASEDRSYWQGWGGGGGAGGVGFVVINRNSVSSITDITIDVGAGGNAPSGGTAGQDGFASVIFQKIVGYDSGSTGTSVGDIIESASSGITTISSSGSGTGSSGGFKLPTTQIPEVVIGAPDVSSGTQATATAVVSNGRVVTVNIVDGGSGYTNVPPVYFYGGAGAGTTALAQVTSGVVTGINIVSSVAHTRYVKIGGSDLERYIILKQFNTTKVEKIAIKVARGNGENGGDLPEQGGDELSIYYNIDGSNSFPYYISVIVPKENFGRTDGSSGNTQWYTYDVVLPPAAKTTTTKFKIVQTRSTADISNDNAGDTDHYGIAEIIYYYEQTTELKFVQSAGQLPTSIDKLEYKVEGNANKLYTAGMQASDLTFSLSSATPLIPYAAIQPKEKIPLLEPYALVKHIIKAF
jgi:hypothetical protein